MELPSLGLAATAAAKAHSTKEARNELMVVIERLT